MQKCVLIYDDDNEILAVCRTILESQDYRVETLTDCERVLEDIEQLKPDIILMDLWIPKTGGENAAILIRGNPLTRHVPLLLFSANEEIEKISRRVHANGYLKKPFDIITLRKIIEAKIL